MNNKLGQKFVLIITVDNASYHNKILNLAPSSNHRKLQTIQWLHEKRSPFNEDMCKPDLYSIIKKNKQDFKIYAIDCLLQQYSHTVVGLSPYQPDVNMMCCLPSFNRFFHFLLLFHSSSPRKNISVQKTFDLNSVIKAFELDFRLTNGEVIYYQILLQCFFQSGPKTQRKSILYTLSIQQELRF